MRTGTVNCIICGSEYEVCRACPTTTLNTPWRVLCDTPVHYQVYHIVQDIKTGIITGEEAKEMLARIRISKADIEGFLPGIKKILLPLFEVEEPKTETKKRSKKISQIEEIKEESETVENIFEDIMEI